MAAGSLIRPASPTRGSSGLYSCLASYVLRGMLLIMLMKQHETVAQSTLRYKKVVPPGRDTTNARAEYHQ